MSIKKELLGDQPLVYESFQGLDEHFHQFHTSAFHTAFPRKKFKQVNQALLELIQKKDAPCFLLPAVLEFIERVNREKLLAETYRFFQFEFWLNRFSRLSEDENLAIRAKIVGKWIPRGDYQAFFPIGMGKVFSGTHFVAAHASPDIDTTIASFWGWVDAFGAKVVEGVHLWSLPHTTPGAFFGDSHFTYLFRSLFSAKVFEQLARTVPALTLTALDLVTQKGISKVHAHTLASHLDHNHADKAIILVDDQELYRGDWRSSDAESVRNITILFNSLIRWFENAIHAKLIATFAKRVLHLDDIQKTIIPIFETEIRTCDPLKEYSERQTKHLNDYLNKILELKGGTASSFMDLWRAVDPLIEEKFSVFYSSLQSLTDPELYDQSQKLIEDRPKIFSRLEKIISHLAEALYSLRNYVERLSVMMEVKEKVLGYPKQFVTLKSDVEEIKTKMNGLEHITVVIPESEGKWYPVGVIHAHDLRRPVLGTVSLRDFSNEQETQMASYLEVISVVDHHKIQLKTSSTPCFLVADVQSSNTLIAEQSLLINEQYRTPKNDKERKGKKNYFIHQRREYVEYLCFLYAILDDTDLLTKVSDRDVVCVAKLLNRMKSIACQQEVEIITLDDLEKDASFAKEAASRILQNQDMYSIYKKIYAYKEEEMEANLANCIEGKPSTVFADTKEQNSCCRVGQTKIFYTNYPFFSKQANALRTIWYHDSQKVYETKNQVDFHLHMISTVAGAEEVYSDHVGDWKHLDEMWLWVPQTNQACERLVNFLIAFSASQEGKNSFEVEFLGPNAKELNQIFEQNFPQAKRTTIGEIAHTGLPIAVLRYKAGTLNSRKAQITPYLPRFVP